MKHNITSVQELGTLIRATRKSVSMRIDDLAATSSLSKQFVSDLELGKPGVNLGKVLEVLRELGVHLYIDVPDAVADQLEHAKLQINNTRGRRLERDDVLVSPGTFPTKRASYVSNDRPFMSKVENGNTNKKRGD